MIITPDQAATLAENYVEPHEMPDCPDAVELWESAYDLAHTIAGMQWQYAVEVYSADAKRWMQGINWIGNKELAEQHLGQYDGDPTRLVRRLVGPKEVAE